MGGGGLDSLDCTTTTSRERGGGRRRVCLVAGVKNGNT